MDKDTREFFVFHELLSTGQECRDLAHRYIDREDRAAILIGLGVAITGLRKCKSEIQKEMKRKAKKK